MLWTDLMKLVDNKQAYVFRIGDIDFEDISSENLEEVARHIGDLRKTAHGLAKRYETQLLAVRTGHYDSYDGGDGIEVFAYLRMSESLQAKIARDKREQNKAAKERTRQMIRAQKETLRRLEAALDDGE